MGSGRSSTPTGPPGTRRRDDDHAPLRLPPLRCRSAPLQRTGPRRRRAPRIPPRAAGGGAAGRRERRGPAERSRAPAPGAAERPSRAGRRRRPAAGAASVRAAASRPWSSAGGHPPSLYIHTGTRRGRGARPGAGLQHQQHTRAHGPTLTHTQTPVRHGGGDTGAGM